MKGKLIKDQVEFFMKEELKCHVKLKDGTFINGLISHKVRDNFYWFKEDVLGDIVLFSNNIDKINIYRKKD